jgi:hypothetical protein
MASSPRPGAGGAAQPAARRSSTPNRILTSTTTEPARLRVASTPSGRTDRLPYHDVDANPLYYGVVDVDQQLDKQANAYLKKS